MMLLVGNKRVVAPTAPTIINGDFGESTGWNQNGDWTIGSGVATNAGSGTITQLVGGEGLLSTATYRVSWDITRWVSGNVRLRFSNSDAGTGSVINGANKNGVGSHSQDLVPNAGNLYLGFNISGTGDLDIDNVTIEKL